MSSHPSTTTVFFLTLPMGVPRPDELDKYYNEAPFKRHVERYAKTLRILTAYLIAGRGQLNAKGCIQFLHNVRNCGCEYFYTEMAKDGCERVLMKRELTEDEIVSGAKKALSEIKEVFKFQGWELSYTIPAITLPQDQYHWMLTLVPISKKAPKTRKRKIVEEV